MNRNIRRGALLVAFSIFSILHIINVAAGHGLSSWAPIISEPGTLFSGLAVGQEHVVAVTTRAPGHGGEIISWRHGEPENRVTYSTPVALSAIAHGNGTFVATGLRGQIVVSTNALDWTAIQMESANCQCL